MVGYGEMAHHVRPNQRGLAAVCNLRVGRQGWQLCLCMYVCPHLGIALLMGFCLTALGLRPHLVVRVLRGICLVLLGGVAVGDSFTFGSA